MPCYIWSYCFRFSAPKGGAETVSGPRQLHAKNRTNKPEDNPVITTLIQGGLSAVGGEIGAIHIVDISSSTVYEYGYWMGGLGIGFGGTAGVEFGLIHNMQNPDKLGGWFWGVSGYAAAIWGGSTSLAFTGLFNNSTFTIGPTTGAGAGINIQLGKMYLINRYNLNK